MNENNEDKSIENLWDKLDALIQKGIELSENLDVADRNDLIKRVINESIIESIANINKSEEENLTKKELSEREEKIRRFIEQYYDEKINKI